MNWLQRIRLRLFAVMLGLALAALATVSLTTIPAWPVLGVAFAVAVAVINTAGQRFTVDQQICLTCGVDISKQPSGPHGVICPSCGGLTQTIPVDEVMVGVERPSDTQPSPASEAVPDSRQA